MVKKVLVLMVITFLLAPFILNTVSATSAPHVLGNEGGGGENGGSEDDEGKKEESGKRETNIDKYSKRAVVTSRWEKGEIKEYLKLKFECNKGSPEFEVDYEANRGSKRVNFSFRIIFQEVFEFKDMNGNGRFDKDDEVISRYGLDGSKFRNIVYEGAQNGYRYRARTTDSIFGIEARVGSDFISYDSQTLTPTETKLGLNLDYDFKAEDSMLSLKISIKNPSQKELEKRTYDEKEGYAEDESWMRFKEDDYSGFFSWNNFADIDGKQHPVNATYTSQSAVTGDESLSKSDDLLYLSYKQGSEITHDPKVGVVGASVLYSPTDLGPSTEYLLMILLITVAVATSIFSGGVYIREKY